MLSLSPSAHGTSYDRLMALGVQLDALVAGGPDAIDRDYLDTLANVADIDLESETFCSVFRRLMLVTRETYDGMNFQPCYRGDWPLEDATIGARLAVDEAALDMLQQLAAVEPTQVAA